MTEGVSVEALSYLTTLPRKIRKRDYILVVGRPDHTMNERGKESEYSIVF